MERTYLTLLFISGMDSGLSSFKKYPQRAHIASPFLDIKGQNYLTVANHYDGSTYSIKSVIYKWSNGTFNKFQEIPTEGARGCTAFAINNDTFVAFANHYNSKQKLCSSVHCVQVVRRDTLLNCSLCRHTEHTEWTLSTSMVTHSSPLPTLTMEVNTTSTPIFTGGMAPSLFCSSPFLLVEPVAWHPFVISGQAFLGVANNYGDSQKYNTQSVVYQASGAQFIKYQEIPTHGARDMTTFEYKGHTYLAVANYYNQKHNINSTLYKWV